MTATTRNPLVTVANLGLALGDRHLNARPGLYHLRVDDHWELWLNPHREEIEEMAEGRSVTVPAFSCYVEFNGWPAGIFNAHEVTFAAGDAANIETFMDAVEARTVAERST